MSAAFLVDGWKMLATFLVVAFQFSCSSPEKEKRQFFRYNQPSAVNSLDPAFAKDQGTIWIANQIFNGLVQLDEGLNVKPCLAKSWEVSEDELTYTFHLRTDVVFQGHEAYKSEEERKLTARDVAFSFSRLIDRSVASPGAWVFNGRVRDETPFEAPNDSTFILHLKSPFRPILGVLSMQYCSVMSEKAVSFLGDRVRSTPVGTGPFQLNNWREGDVLLLEKNEDYWEETVGEKLPYLDGVRITFKENKKAAYLDFVAGETDFLSGIDPAYVDELLTDEGELKPGLDYQLQKMPYLNTEYLGFLMTEKGALSNVKVRQAINFGFDREKMIRFLRNGIGAAATSGFIPRGLPAFHSAGGYTYRPEKARQLLKEAGYEGGKGLSVIQLETTSSYLDLCTFIQRQLKEVGIETEITTLPSSLLREKMSKSESSFFRGSWIADYPDEESFLTVFYGGNPAPPNYTRFTNSDFDALYERALGEKSDVERRKLYRSMDSIIIAQAPVVPLFYDEVVRFLQPKVKGLPTNGMNLLSLKGWSWGGELHLIAN